MKNSRHAPQGIPLPPPQGGASRNAIMRFTTVCPLFTNIFNFIRQRTDYFAAEAVRRGTRDVYGDSEEEYFQILLDEIYNGIIDVYKSAKYKTGFERLEAVLIEAKGTPVDQCRLSRDTVWIGNSQKKGVCHILINENVLKGWVKKDATGI